jgi:hypothetical protein
LATFTSIGYPRGEIEARNGLGEACLVAGHPRRAEEEHRAAMALAAEIGDSYEHARARAGLTALSPP